MLLDHLGLRHGRDELVQAARCLKESLDALLAEPATRTPDLGRRLATKAFGRAVAERVAGG
jgi:isocitrate/isopropylmalate dehydrogenase